MKKYVKKILIAIFIVICIYFTIDYFLFKKEMNEKKNSNNNVRISFVEIDYNKTKQMSFDTNEYLNHLINVYSVTEPVKEEGKYYTSIVKDVNKLGFKNIKKISTTLNDLQGRSVYDVKYDKKTHKVFIPKKYYTEKKYKKYSNCPIVLEIVNAQKRNVLDKTNTNVLIKKFFTQKKIYTSKKYYEEPVISIYEYGKGRHITKNDFILYANNSKVPLSKKAYSYDAKAGTIKLNNEPFFYDSIKVKFKKIALIKNFVFSFLNFGNVKAESSSNVKADVTFDANGTGKTKQYLDGEKVTSDLSYYYDADEGYYHDGHYYSGNIPKKVTKFAIKANSDFSSDNVIDTKYYNFYVYVGTIKFTKESGDNDVTLTVKVNRWFRAACANHETAAGIPDNLTTKFTLYVNDDSYYIGMNSTNTVTTQTMKGGFSTNSEEYWVAVQKGHFDSSGNMTYWAKKNIVFRLYENYVAGDPADCSGLIESKKTDSDGYVYFSGLPNGGQYCIKEIFNEDDDNSSISSKNYGRDANCNGTAGDKAKKVTAISMPNDINSGSYEEPLHDYCNIRKYYSLSASKYDKNTLSIINNGNEAKFRVTTPNAISIGNDNYAAGATIYEGNTDQGRLSVCGLPEYTNYRISEVIPPNGYYLSNSYINYPASALSSYYVNKPCNIQIIQENDKDKYRIENEEYYFCARVKKVDDNSGRVISNTGFTTYRDTSTSTQIGSEVMTDSNGVSTFFYRHDNNNKTGKFYIKETSAPEGYALSNEVKEVSVSTMDSSTTSASWQDVSKCPANAETYVFHDKPLLLNWYKVAEDGEKKINNAKFKVKVSDTNSYVTVNGTDEVQDVYGTRKTCYKYSGLSTVGSELTSMNTNTNGVETNGEVCISGIPEDLYTIEETKSGDNHALGSEVSKNLRVYEDSTAFFGMTESNKFVNIPTVFKFRKTVNNTDGSQEGNTKYTIVENGVTKTVSLSEMTTEQLKKISFYIINEDGEALKFVEDENGVYQYDNNNVDGPIIIGGETNMLHLNDNREIIVEHLPVGNYSIKEYDTSSCRIQSTGTYGSYNNPTTQPSTAASCSNSSGNSGDCIGYYSPDYSQDSSHQFSITNCSNPSSNADACTVHVEASKTLENKPTELTFTKKDFYNENDSADIQDKNRDKDSKESTAEFADDKERSDFDRIDFKVKDPSGNYLNLIYLGKHGNCKDDNSYSIYRYVPGLALPSGVSADTFNNTIGGVTQTLHACGGHIKVINLCRGNKYTFEEVKVPDDSVYVLENNEGTNPSICFTIPCTEGTPVPTSETHTIVDKPTYVRFEKRDSKYNYLIPDETTTFRVYRCPKDNPNCHPTDYSTVDSRGRIVVDEARATAAGLKLVKFNPRAIIQGDEETPTGPEGEAGVEVYRSMSDSDAEGKNECTAANKNNCYEVNLHPQYGVLVLRYLQASESGYHYVLVETVAPRNYLLPTGTSAETNFTVTNRTVNVDSEQYPNKPTSLIIRKYDDKGNLLPGAEFKIYKSNTCDKDQNLSELAKNSSVQRFKTIRDGIYENRPILTDEIVKTCKDTDDVKCSSIGDTLTYSENVNNDDINNNYIGSFADWYNTRDLDGNNIEIKEGEALIQYLEYNSCYIIEEVKAPEGYSLPEKDEDRFTMVEIKENETNYVDTYQTFINKPTPFTFYKYDEFNKLLDGAEFKLQKLNKNKKYEDIPVDLTEKAEDGSLFYKVNKDGNNYTITTHNGSATVYFLEAGQYRIVETKPAPGKELSKNPNIATFFVDSEGKVYGNAVIANKSKTKRVDVVPTASAELIVNIQTGQTVIRYGLVIAILIASITGLMIYNKKRK